ncbi:DeoR faimly transcriptional regulator, partial [Streptomyces varsoviensis]
MCIRDSSGTARTDDPQLSARLPDTEISQPLRVVVDTTATAVRPGARVLDGTAPTLIAVAEDAEVGHLDGLAPVVRLPRAAGGRGLD